MRIIGPDDPPEAREPARTVLVPAGAGEVVHVLADSATLKVGQEDTAGALSMVELTLQPGGAVPDHLHAHEDETLYVLEGTLDVRVGDQRLTLGAGGCAFAPRGTAHAFANRGFAPARVLQVSSPAVEPTRAFLELAAGFAAGVAAGPHGPVARPDGGVLASAFRALAASRDVTLVPTDDAAG
ncbi:cupin domain-containing protein [Roseisolibacter sp. H3M3-2]|uniref:cupin domain-containing protein n=1 Tax=Roseisolibacter sp. H3M3-2 TaxID=3031323 RepID=UPI0023DA0F78|nr:cupin domain-containing protein [Roseisolibacter sp. H3M3-2]MDF1505795.1 cupin domain-containing protein [Roseisolibacter sp. H3M3-2]